MGEKQYGIDEKRLAEYAAQIKEIHEQGVQIGIVIGGGNIFRGLSGANKGFDRVKGDQMGMLATVINSLALSSALVAAGVKARVLTAVRMEPIGEFYSKWKAIEEEWLRLFRNHKSVDGLSATAEVSGKDEWLCEAYMKTDYTKLCEEDFQKTLNNYLAYLMKEGKIYES